MRNADVTREKLLLAATAEFAAHGAAGARIDRIAERAGVNKRMIYAYFGSKERLLETVLEHSLGRARRGCPGHGRRPAGLRRPPLRLPGRSPRTAPACPVALAGELTARRGGGTRHRREAGGAVGGQGAGHRA